VLAAHVVPGYFAAAHAEGDRPPSWGPRRRALLWAVAVGSTVAPDLDVVYHVLFRGFFNHSVLWTHSVFVYLILGAMGLGLRLGRRAPYLRAVLGLAAAGGLSHVLLDVVAHGTPLLYPLSMAAFGGPSRWVVEGGVMAYLTDPLFLLEPLLLCAAAVHALRRVAPPTRARRFLVALMWGAVGAFSLAFLVGLSVLRDQVAPWVGG
jgi:membrane-bound metal-dependent hydrolase YbcI (DUF457 family)